MYRLGFIVVLVISCRNAGDGRSQVRDSAPDAKLRDTQPVLEARDTPPAPKRQLAPATSPEDTMPPQAIRLAKRPAGPPVDTVLRIEIDDASLEGSGVKATYTRDTLRSAIWNIYGESFKAQVTYTFSPDGKVHVKEKESRYTARLEDVRSKKDMKTDSTFYFIDTNGVLLSKVGRNFDTTGTREQFVIFKKNVPMILKP